MNKRVKSLTSTFTMITLLGTLLMTNSVDAAHAQSSTIQVATLAATGEAQCRLLSPEDMAQLSGSGWADWAVALIDLGCVSGSTAAVLKMTSPLVGAFCAGWAVGRYISG